MDIAELGDEALSLVAGGGDKQGHVYPIPMGHDTTTKR